MAKYKLGDICEIVSGSTPKTSIPEYWDGEIKWITPAELNDDTYIVADSVRKITELGVQKTGLSPFPSGTVILSSRAPIGKVAIAGCEMYCNQGFKNLICSDVINNRYLFWFLKGNSVLLNSLGRGATFKEISKQIVGDIEINVPDMSEQLQAVERFEKIRRIILLRKKQLAELDNLIKARFVEMFGDVIHNNKSWQMHVFADIASSRLGKMLDAKQQTGKCSYPYLANFNVQWFRFNIENLNQMDFDEDDRAEFELKDGDLLVCEGGEIGRCAVWHNEIQPCFFQKALHRVRCNRQIIHPDYLAWWFKYNCDHDGFAAIAGAKATIAHLPGVKLKQLQVAVPPLELQEQFAAFVEQVDKSKVAEATHTLCTLFNIILNGGTRYDIRTNEF